MKPFPIWFDSSWIILITFWKLNQSLKKWWMWKAISNASDVAICLSSGSLALFSERVTSVLIIWFAIILQRKLYLVYWLNTWTSGHKQRGDKSEKLDIVESIKLAEGLGWNYQIWVTTELKFDANFSAISSNFSLLFMFPVISCKCVIQLKAFQSLLADSDYYQLTLWSGVLSFLSWQKRTLDRKLFLNRVDKFPNRTTVLKWLKNM